MSNLHVAKGWHTCDTHGYKIPPDPAKGRIFCYDYDDTLAQRGKAIPLPGVSERLQQHASDGDTIVIFTNRKRQKHQTIQANINAFERVLGLTNIWAFYAQYDDRYRKPDTGMFELFISLSCADRRNVVYYCGDAAGRAGDFSDSDLYFARNIGIDFKTPEEVFMGTL